MLIILKLFKLKLLLFLPFILGLTGLKKILSIGAFVIPGNLYTSHLLNTTCIMHLINVIF